MSVAEPLPPDITKAHGDVSWLAGRFAAVLRDLGEDALAESLPWVGAIAAQPGPTLHGPATHALSISFQLLNLVEENAAAHGRRVVQQEGVHRERGLWADVLNRLVGLGLSERGIAEGLAGVHVELVLTAHPTEAKRATVLEHYRWLYSLLERRENTIWTPLEQQALTDDCDAALERLWRTGDVFLEKPDVSAELSSAVYYLRRIFPGVLEQLDKRLQQEWNALGFDPELVTHPASLPRMSFSTWVGGDRDGHPFVTAEVTRQSLAMLRDNALDLVRHQLVELAHRISLSSRLQHPPNELLDHVSYLRALLGSAGDTAVARNPDEPWRQLVNLMLARLPIEHGTGTYGSADELSADLRLLSESLVAVGARRLAQVDVRPVQRTVDAFGFHLASLDIRQSSAFHDRAVSQLLTAAGLANSDLMQRDLTQWDVTRWAEATRIEFLERELASPRPFTRPDTALGPEASAVLACYRVLVDELAAHGPSGLGSLIVSMTRSAADLLTVYLLAQEVGLLIETADGPICPLPVVPLFETIDDLEHCPGVLDTFLSHPITKRSLKAQRRTTGEAPVQQVMVGYSDSNKDGGIIASLWGLHRAQARTVEVGDAHGVRIRFFHGRGGTISRGAGPTGRFLRALPGSALRGDLRMTEQGETVAQKYANRVTAVYNLELLQAGVAEATLTHEHSAVAPHPLEPALDRMAVHSRAAYTALLAQDGFMAFYAKATPIDVIEQSRIGSRPARRTGSRSINDLRAIPWVFSWSQARFYLSGWFGVGTALEELSIGDPDAFAMVVAEHRWWAPIHYILSNAATSVMTADRDTMRAYADLVESDEVRTRILGLILDEYDRTERMLEVLYGGPLAEQRPRINAMLAVRQQGLSGLHRHQLQLLRTWRAAVQDGRHVEAGEMLPTLLMTVNAIAGGLRTTG